MKKIYILTLLTILLCASSSAQFNNEPCKDCDTARTNFLQNKKIGANRQFSTKTYSSESLSKNGGCLLASSQGTTDLGEIFNSSGNPQIDNNVFQDLELISRIYGLKSTLYYLKEKNEPNAYCEPNGIVYLGLKLINFSLQKNNGAAIPFILAHELGHAKMFKMKYQFNSGKKEELFADFIAGTYLYVKSNISRSDFEHSIKEFFDIGDFAFNSPSHHGTPQERVDAFIAGYEWQLRFQTRTLDIKLYEKYRKPNQPLDLIYSAAMYFLDTVQD